MISGQSYIGDVGRLDCVSGTESRRAARTSKSRALDECPDDVAHGALLLSVAVAGCRQHGGTARATKASEGSYRTG
jgi:hypothetical protein